MWKVKIRPRFLPPVDQEGPGSFATLRRVVGSIRKQPEGIDHAKEIDCDCTGGIGSRVCVRAALERWHRGGGASVRSAAKVQLRAATAPAGLLRPPAGGHRRLPDLWLWLLPAAIPRLRLSPSLRPPLLSARSSLALTRSAQLARPCAGALECWRLRPAVANLVSHVTSSDQSQLRRIGRLRKRLRVGSGLEVSVDWTM